MLIRKISIENVRSFLDRTEIIFDGNISIIVGPNGGGKTNLLDVIHSIVRGYLFARPYASLIEMGDGRERYRLEYNNHIGNVLNEKHINGGHLRQIVEVEIEVSQADLDNMQSIRSDAARMPGLSRRVFEENPWSQVLNWNIVNIKAKDRLVYRWDNGQFKSEMDKRHSHFLEYLRFHEFDNEIRAEAGMDPLKMSMIYLPVNRASFGFTSSINLAEYDDSSQKRSADGISSRTGGSIMSLAVGRLAGKYRLMQEDNNVNAKERFYSEKNLEEMSLALRNLGYEWELTLINALRNQYDIKLHKNGSSFLVSAASSGERELLTYLFAVYALNIRDALIIVDEPELHLHPRWQAALFDLFVSLSKSTGNQFVLATHSPTFISPASVQFVSRVYMSQQNSKIFRLNAVGLPDAKHLFSIVNSQNNEIVFFSDRILLVEGISDKIVLSKVLEILLKEAKKPASQSIEIVSVGGKGLFDAYRRLLVACGVESSLIADLDYVEQIGDQSIKRLFRVNSAEIRKDVIDNVKSLDGATIVKNIEEAISTGDWSHASEVWEYIKSRRVMLKEDLTESESASLMEFIMKKRDEGIYLLARGDLEDYLPEGYKSKDLGKLIEFVSSSAFWEKLRPEAREELTELGRRILNLVEPVAVQ